MTVEEFLTRLERVKPHGSYHTARCPGHEDNRESLSISEGQGGKIVLKCHAGCGVRDIVEKMNLTMSDLFPPKEEKPAPPSSQKTLIARYGYTDEEGKLLFEALRYQPKEFRQRAPDGKGGWSWSLQGVRRVPYNLPKVIEQASAGKVVFVVEGEKDADALGALGLVATTNAAGAGKWLPDFGKYLAGAHVVILPDNDEPGAKHGREVAASCLPHAADVRIALLPELPAKGDTSDWLKAGGTKEQLLEVAKATPPVKAEDLVEPAEERPAEKEIELTGLCQFNKTDAGNAERLIARHGEDLRFVPGLGWRVWDGRRWAADETTVTRYARDTVRALYGEAEELLAQAHTEPDKETRKQLATSAGQLTAFALKSESTRALAAMVEQSKSFAEIAAEASRFDLKPWLVPFQNGVWDRGKWRAHARQDFTEHLLPVCYDKDADRAEWLALLNRMTGGDAQLCRTLQDVAGYCLSGASTLRLLPWAYGPKGTGKSTFAELLQTVLGASGKTVDSTLLSGDREDERLGAAIRGMRAIFLPEAGRKRLDAETLKSLTGGDRRPARNLYSNVTLSIVPSWAVFAVANDPPAMNAHDEALRDRVIALPFVHKLDQGEELAFTGGKRLEEVRRTIDSALVAGFVAWVVEGLERVHEAQEIYKAPVVAEHTRLFWNETDTLTPFWEGLDKGELERGMAASALHGSYLAWCEKEGQKRPLQGRAFAAACRAAGLEQKRGEKGIIWFQPSPSLPLQDSVNPVGMYEKPPFSENPPKKIVIEEFSKNTPFSYIPTGFTESDDIDDPYANTPGGSRYQAPLTNEPEEEIF